MAEIDTYNRVKVLEVKKAKGFLSMIAYVLLIGGVIGFTALFFIEYSLYLILAGVGLAFGISISLFVYVKQQIRICQYCGQRLEIITRPLIFKNRHFSEGVVIDDEVFMRRSQGLIPFKRQWVRLHHQSLACHNCRVYEEGYYEAAVPAAEVELKKIHLAQGKKR